VSKPHLGMSSEGSSGVLLSSIARVEVGMVAMVAMTGSGPPPVPSVLISSDAEVGGVWAVYSFHSMIGSPESFFAMVPVMRSDGCGVLFSVVRFPLSSMYTLVPDFTLPPGVKLLSLKEYAGEIVGDTSYSIRAPRFHVPVERMTSAVRVQMQMVSMNGPMPPTIPSRAGSLVLAAACAIGAEPWPASLEKRARFIPCENAHAREPPTNAPAGFDALPPSQSGRPDWTTSLRRPGISPRCMASTAKAQSK